MTNNSCLDLCRVTSELGTSISLDPDAPDQSPRFLMISARVHHILDKPQDFNYTTHRRC